MKKETFWALLLLLLQLTVFRKLLLDGTVTYTHDNYSWDLPLFTFFTKHLWSGEFPLWNPFSHGGEPFFPQLIQLRLLEPFTLLQIFLFKLLPVTAIQTLNWNRFLLAWVTSFGTYLCLRPLCRSLMVRLLLISLLLLSPFFWGTFQQDGFLNQFLWFPYVLYIFCQIHRQKKATNLQLALLSLFIGWSFQSYFFCGMAVICLFAIAGLWFFHKKEFSYFDKRFLILIPLFLLMALPELSIWNVKPILLFPLRAMEASQGLLGVKEAESNVFTSYSIAIITGAFSSPWDLTQLITPEGNRFLFPPNLVWGKSSEAYLYFGLLCSFFILAGMVLGKHQYKKLVLFMTAAISLMMLGHKALLYRLLFPFFPPLWLMRNQHCLVLYLEFFLLYFCVLGANLILEEGKKFPTRLNGKSTAFSFLFSAALCSLPLFKWPLDIFFPLPVIVVAITGVYLFKNISREEFFLSLFVGYLVSVIISIALNRPERLPFLLVYWGVLSVLPRFIANKRLIIAAVTCDLIFCLVRAELIYSHILPPSPKPTHSITRSVLPEEASGCQADKEDCLYNYELWAEKRFLFPAAYKPVPPHLSDLDKITWAKKQRLINAFIVLKTYPHLIATESDERIKDLFAIEESPFSCNTACQIRVGALTLNRASLNVELKDKATLFWSDGFDPYWKAEVDKNPAEVTLLEGHFKGVALEPGNHEVTFTYRPWFFIISLCLFYGWSLLVTLWAIVTRLRLVRPYNKEP
jgi:hypothetical protein